VWGDIAEAALRAPLALGFQYCGIARGLRPGDAESCGHAALLVAEDVRLALEHDLVAGPLVVQGVWQGKVDAAVERARKALRGDDMTEIRAAQEELTKVFSEAGQAFYQQQGQAGAQPEAGQPAGAGSTAGGDGAAKPADDVVEADYEIVDEKK